MRFGVLGPLEVWTADGRPVRVPELKVRALLADLLVHEGRTVSVDRLVEDLWGADPPGNPANTLQTKVSQLRRALEAAEPGGRELVAFRAPGYALRTETDTSTDTSTDTGVRVDADRFRELAARARAAREPGARAALFAEALALWRGPAYADFADEPFVRDAVVRLEEEWLTVVEEQAEARLELGDRDARSGRLAGELAALVGRYPLRERLWAARMRALYAAGRQSEALAAYGALRERLSEELGLDPGPELAALHRSILSQDPELDAGTGRAVGRTEEAPAATVPRTNLPAPLTRLVGRDDAVATVRALLEAERLVTLTGPGGVGKTRLAVATAAQLPADRCPDGVWLVELAGLVRPGDPEAACTVEEVLLAVLGVRDDDPGGRNAQPVRLSDVLRDKRMLLVLDNCEHVVEQVAELAGRLLQAAPGLRILATGQEPLALPGEAVWSVPPLAEPAALELFAARAAAAAPDFRLDEEGVREAAAAICRRLDGIPLALELAATRVRVLGVAELARRLDDRFRVLGGAYGHRGAPVRQRTLRAMIDWSWELLTASEQIVLRRLAVHAESCSLEAAEEVCAGDGVRREDVLELLARLVDRSLVTVVTPPGGGDGAPRYRLLESVAAYCLERLREAGEPDRLRRRHRAWYAALAARAEPLLRGPEQLRLLARLDAETPNLRAALDGAVRDGDRDLALSLANSLTWYWFLRGRTREARRSLPAATGTAGPEPGPEPGPGPGPGPGPAEHTVAAARAGAWAAGMGLLECGVRGAAARAYEALAGFDRADAPDTAGAPDAPDAPDAPGSRGERARAEWFLGYALFLAGDELAEGEALTARALDGLRAAGDRWGTAAALAVRSRHALLRGALDAAARDAEESTRLFTELGDAWGQTQAGEPLASLAEIAGDYERAARLHRDGLRRAEELELWSVAADRLSGLAGIEMLLGRHGEARQLFERARRTAAGRGYETGEVHARVGLGLLARRTGELDTAETHLTAMLDWHRQVDFEPGNALLLAELGFVAELRGDPDTAHTLHLDGLRSARKVGDPRGIALALEGLAGARSPGPPARAPDGSGATAAVLLGAAAAARSAAGAPLPAGERGDVDRIAARVRAALGDEAYAAAYGRGSRTDLPSLLRELLGDEPPQAYGTGASTGADTGTDAGADTGTDAGTDTAPGRARTAPQAARPQR
ncbi:AfsR/SARP family transcriptional regulator [Streptomyces armeniacus]|uniref:AfsR/SARP family transcriptional regulator n=1 Tax=Streptomyces armeniacus TaxID=83291 RepID=A0A345XU61_9ACTN|nr:BTAD domain-containing putative transcriptional regulator [Streptomyces armeniacus]AXK35177.1 AfsR/SARP family transcriptional regulator [Streptomyces armeniacus]